MSTPKKAEVLERMKNGETLRHSIGFHSETWLLGNERVNGNTGNAVVKSPSVKYLRQNGRFTEYAWKSETIPAQEALEVERTQAADDLAGKEAYEDVKAEDKKQRCETCKGYGVLRDGTLIYRCHICNPSETTQLRAEIEALKAENLRLTAGIQAQIEHEQAVIKANERYNEGFYMGRVDSANHTKASLEKLLQPAPTAQAASEVAPAPKKPVPTRCRVNWNQRGFSSGSYPVLGYSLEKQSYILDISTDCNRAMPKTVKMADCESAS